MVSILKQREGGWSTRPWESRRGSRRKGLDQQLNWNQTSPPEQQRAVSGCFCLPSYTSFRGSLSLSRPIGAAVSLPGEEDKLVPNTAQVC